MSFTFDRRNFLRFAAGGAVGAATSGVSLKGISTLNAALDSEQVRVPTGPESWATGICNMCPGGCGLRVRLIGKRAVKIQGNPFHPVNRGGLCPKGLAGLQELYHPDRLRKARLNTGTRENPRWKEISCDEATAQLTERMRKLRDSGEARSFVLVDRQRSGLLPRLVSRFMSAYGSPNYIVMPSGLDALQAAVHAQQGVTGPVAYDFANSRYVLSFGVNLLEGWGAPVSMMRSFSRWRDVASGQRTKFVQIEPRFSMTAARADEWVPVRPGTEATLALGMAYVLISEGLYDAEFVREHTFAFEDWRDGEGNSHSGFKSLVKSEYRLNEAAAITGVPADTILRLAREAAQNRPVVAVGDRHTSTLPGNVYAAMAVHSLNALLGSIDVPGGVLTQQPLPGDQMVPGKDPLLSPRGPYQPDASQLPQVISSRRPYRVQMLLLNQVNPVFALSNGADFRSAMRDVPFIVSFSPFLDDTSALADLVIPAPTGLECWQDTAAPPAMANAMISISPPAVRPRKDVRHLADVMIGVAHAMGGAVAAALPFAGYEEFLRAEVNDIYAAQAGAVFGSTLEDSWNRLMERSGWWAPSYSSSDELWDQIKKQGGWWEPAYSHGEWSRVLRTKSGKFEFYSQALAALRPRGAVAADDKLCLPHQPAVSETTTNFPLLLMPVEQLPLAGGEGAHLPYLQQIAGEQVFASWDSWLEIHPETAHTFGISDGDSVWIESRRGRVKARVRFYDGARPGVVHMPLGYGHTAGGDWACRGTNPLDIVEQQTDSIAGVPSVHGTCVKVYRA